jgi:hypothetical protein
MADFERSSGDHKWDALKVAEILVDAPLSRKQLKTLETGLQAIFEAASAAIGGHYETKWKAGKILLALAERIHQENDSGIQPA